MLRRPSVPTPSTLPAGSTALLQRGRSAGPTLGPRTVPEARHPLPPSAPAGVIPRRRSPRGSTPTGRGPAAVRTPAAGPVGEPPATEGAATVLDELIEHHLTRLRDGGDAPRPGVIDDDTARCDPPTAPFAAVLPDPRPVSGSQPVRVATGADRPVTAELPAVLDFY